MSVATPSVEQTHTKRWPSVTGERSTHAAPLLSLSGLLSCCVWPVALGITYPEKSVAPAASLFRTVIPRFTRAKGVSYFNRYITCPESTLFYPLAFCTPTDAEGNHLLKPVQNELDGSSALGLDLSDWPLYFESTTDQLCLTAFHLANTSLLGPKLWEVPQIGLVPLSAQLALAAVEHGVAGHRSANDSAVLAFVGLLPTQTFYGYNSNHYISFRASLTRRANGQQSLDYEYSEGRDVKLAVDSFPAYRAALVETLQQFNSSHAQNVSAWLAMPEEEVSFFVSELCFGPQSFVGTVVTEQSPYGIVSFLADLGQWLATLAAALSASRRPDGRQKAQRVAPSLLQCSHLSVRFFVLPCLSRWFSSLSLSRSLSVFSRCAQVVSQIW